MSSGLFFPLNAIFYSGLVLIIFFSKKHVNNTETKLYGYLIISNFIGLIIEIFCTLGTIIYDKYPLISSIIYKLYLIYIITWISIFASYMIFLTINDKNAIKLKLKLKKMFTIVFWLSVIYIVYSPIYLKTINDSKTGYTYGNGVTLSYIVSAIYITIMLIFIFKNFRKLKLKKFIPMFTFLTIGSASMVIQGFNPGLLLVTSMETLVSVIMYFTIENPDLQIIKELVVNREITEKAMEDKSNTLFKITAEVKKPAQNILDNVSYYKKTLKKNQEPLLEIEQNAKDLLFVVNEALDVSSLTSSNIKVIDNLYFPYNLFDTIKIKKSKQVPSNVTMNFNVSRSIPEKLYGDSIKLRQILSSLIDNSITHTKDGVIDIEISTIIKYDVCRLLITVSDTGDGMTLEQVNDILSTKEELTKEEKAGLEGSNISLKAIVKIIKILNGAINIKVKDQGTEVFIVLDQLISKETEKNNSLFNRKIDGRKRIMYIHKYTNKSRRLESKFEDKETGIVSVLFINQAKEMLKNRELFDLIVVNDEVKALETLKELKYIKNNKAPICVLVAKGNEFLKKHYLADGFDDILLEENIEEDIKRIKDKYL